MIIIPLVIKPTFQNLVAILGVAGLALGFAFKDYISSIIAGIAVIYERCYRPGDWVKIDDAYGEIKSLAIKNTEAGDARRHYCYHSPHQNMEYQYLQRQ